MRRGVVGGGGVGKCCVGESKGLDKRVWGGGILEALVI